MTLKHLLFAITLLSVSLNNHAQTTLAAGDLAIIGFKTTGAGRDYVRILVLKHMDCGTTFIVTDNNWRNSGTWYCDNDEFGIEVTVTVPVNAGSVILIDVDDPTRNAPSVESGSGALTDVGLGNPWGTNYGLNSSGDNVILLQGTRAAPNFIYAVRNCGDFSLGGDCSSGSCGSSAKNNTALPTGLTIGTTAIENFGEFNRAAYNCSTGGTSGTKADIIAAIANKANWDSPSATDFMSGANYTTNCTFTVTDAGAPFGACGVVLSTGDFILKSSCKNDENELQWYTLNESSNFKQLTLESSTSEDNFEGIYTLKTSIESNKIYSYKHSNGKKATYYRLRYIDENGFTKYSDVVAASCKNANEFSIYPNPAKNSVNVTISYLEKGSDASLIVYNVLGEIVYLTTINSPQQVIINSERFSSGIYYLVLSTEKDKQTQKLVISNN